MKNQTTPFDSSLHHLGRRLTPQRMAILAYLEECCEHPTAQQVYEGVKVQYPSLSLATVYNTLELLASMGKVNILGHIGDDVVHYDGNTEPHINLGCVNCKKIIDVSSEQVAHLTDEVKSLSGYALSGVRVMYYGVCPSCQNQQA